MKENPVGPIEVPKIEKRIPPKLTKQQAMRLLEVAYNYPYKYRFLRYRNHAMLSVLIYTGIRRNELLHLKYTDVDIENMSLFIRQGKGSKDRVLPICATLAEILVTYLKERKKLNKTLARTPYTRHIV